MTKRRSSCAPSSSLSPLPLLAFLPRIGSVPAPRETLSPAHPIDPGPPLSESCRRGLGRRQHLDDERTGGRTDFRAGYSILRTPATLYAGTHSAAASSRAPTAGRIGAPSTPAWTPRFVVSALVIDPTTPATLYAGTGMVSVWRRQRRLQEHQRGGSWTAINIGLTSTGCHCPGHRSFCAGHALRQHV